MAMSIVGMESMLEPGAGFAGSLDIDRQQTVCGLGKAEGVEEDEREGRGGES